MGQTCNAEPANGIPLPDATDVIALDAALTELERIAPRQSRVIELRYLGGLSLGETAAEFQVCVVSVRRDWSLARAWLFREFEPEWLILTPAAALEREDERDGVIRSRARCTTGENGLSASGAPGLSGVAEP